MLMVRERQDLPKPSREDRDRFTLVADYEPAGDQVAAIAGLIEGLNDGLREVQESAAQDNRG